MYVIYEISMLLFIKFQFRCPWSNIDFSAKAAIIVLQNNATITQRPRSLNIPRFT